MNELDEQQYEAIIDQALQDYPLTPLPTHFVAQVMARVTHLPQWRPEPFRLQWRDVVVPAITAVFIYLLLSLSLWLLGQDVTWLPEAPTLFSIGADSLRTIGWFSIMLMMVVGEIGLLLLVGANLWWDRPFLVNSEP
jgi:hypothetical protein